MKKLIFEDMDAQLIKWHNIRSKIDLFQNKYLDTVTTYLISLNQCLKKTHQNDLTIPNDAT